MRSVPLSPADVLGSRPRKGGRVTPGCARLRADFGRSGRGPESAFRALSALRLQIRPPDPPTHLGVGCESFVRGRLVCLPPARPDSMGVDEIFSDHKTFFTSFLDTRRGVEYDHRLRDLAKTADGKASQRLLLSVSDIRQFDPDLAARLLRQPLQFLAPWTEVITERLHQYINLRARTSETSNSVDVRANIGFVGAFGSHQISPRGLRACQLGALVCVEGVVTRCSLSQPKVVRSVHWCAATQQHTIREYRDSTALDLGAIPPIAGGKNNEKLPRDTASYPTCDVEGNALETEFGLSMYKDHQCVTIQESPERAPLGQLPRSVCICAMHININIVLFQVDAFLDDDLVDSVKPGDRVRCAGVYRALAHSSSIPSGVFRTVILANSLATDGHDNTSMALTSRDVANVRAVVQSTASN